MKSIPIKALFVDIGGVLLTNGWDHSMRQQAAQLFGLDLVEMDKRHALTFDTYEIGKITLEEYLTRIVFYEPRSFSREEFKQFMFKQSQPYPSMIDLISTLKIHYHLKIVAVSNEGRELVDYRVNRFDLRKFIDFFVFSCFVHLRKPDTEIYKLALDLAQVEPNQAIYIDDRSMLVEIATQLGMKGIHHTSTETTQKALEDILK